MVPVPRPLNSIHAFLFLTRRASLALVLDQGMLSSGKRADTPASVMASSSAIHAAEGVEDAATDDTDTGRIWIHRPCVVAPSSNSAATERAIAMRCPRPKRTPPPPSRVRRAGALASLRRSKAVLFASQFRSRVPEDAATRVRRRAVRSPSGAGAVGVTTYAPGEGGGGDGARGAERAAAPPCRGICLHVHGGGWLWGDSRDQVAHRCLEMASAMNVAVVSVDYGLIGQANAHDFDPVNDVSVAMEWIESHGARELNARPRFVASGESSGAHLLVLAMLNRRDRDKASSPTESKTLASTSLWKCLNLVYGVFDISGTPSVRSDGDSSSPLSGNDLLWMYDLYHAEIQESMDSAHNFDSGSAGRNPTGTDRKDPSLSPMYANLARLPPALFTVGTVDPLLDDSRLMAHRYGAAGNDAELALYEGGEHGLGHFGEQEDEEMGKRARARTLEFMAKFL